MTNTLKKITFSLWGILILIMAGGSRNNCRKTVRNKSCRDLYLQLAFFYWALDSSNHTLSCLHLQAPSQKKKSHLCPTSGIHSHIIGSTDHTSLGDTGKRPPATRGQSGDNIHHKRRTDSRLSFWRITKTV